VAAHDNQLATTVNTVHALTQQLHAEGPGIVDSLNSVDHLIGSVQGLLGQANTSSLPTDLADLQSITGVLASNTGTVDKLINGFVQAFSTFDRVSQNGNWVNIYPCSVNAVTYGNIQVTSADTAAALRHLVGGPLGDLLGSLGNSLASLLSLAVPIPLEFPNGPVGTTNAHTKVCS
jgi:ABC-type transporter Mla subunit MlaD